MTTTTPSTPSDSLFQRLKRVAPWFAGHPGALVLGIVGIFVGAATEPAIPALMKPLLDSGFDRGTLELWKIPVVLLLLFGIRGFAGFVAAYCLARVTNYSMELLRQRLFEKLLRADPQLFADKHTSGLTNTMVYEVNNGANLLVTTMLAFAKDLVTLLALLGYLLVLNWKLTLIVFAIFPPIAWVVKNLSRRLDHVTRASQDATDELAYVVEENVLAYRMVRLHNAQSSQAHKFSSSNQKLRALSLKAVIANSVMTPLIQMFAALALSAVIMVALYQSSGDGATQGVTVGSFAAFITGMLMLISPIKHLSEVAGTLTRGVTSLERGLNLLDLAPDETQGTHTSAHAKGEICFDQVTLQYPSATSPALNGVSLTIQPGQTVALVGPSGSGKTTLANLLPRFLDPSSGQVHLDGMPLQDWSLASLRSQVAYVSQDVVMFNDTVAQNIALGETVDTARVWSALVAANLGDFVRSLPHQENTLVGHNATQLSGGQRQRLAIARAIYKDAPILILDEATSALDTTSEQAVKDALNVLMQGRTSLVIAHRLSTIEHADLIVVMQGGSIVETGTHGQLMAQNGAYAALYKVAAQNTDNHFSDATPL
ncbi:lipid A export permease/ATP-binding protein MsbA [Limnohabitans sp. Jir61]|jgi:subfamily B ATP-binding cassette protein MsbA|uniref:lipid A export permease/ATP-binding protein MsbA n=1 Tax=Limnohabitans sp. Jir61 TaxID=1826168 RepID=UPI000D3C85F5|nr:lipid A export permease/ATP-binding protein MsbA [Limnohabitans sp. Jir61]PUE33065.1 lipid A export permease/ATP-binding protein MsbA [Limnohabitans sp. Jir61]